MSSSSRVLPPKPYEELKSAYPDVAAAYEKLGEALHGAGPLESGTRELVKMGMAIGAGLESGTKAHARLALDAGMTPEQVRHAALLAITTVGWPGMMRGMTWVNDELRKYASGSVVFPDRERG